MPSWLLPEHIADILPADARKLEQLRRKLLDHFQRYGYELVQPPLLEYLESLLAGAGPDTELRTFKIIDQISGRTMGLRPDMTPQVARIDAHLLNRNSITRLCYAGSVLHTQPAGISATREPIQIGAELYGYAGIEADAEIAELAITSLSLAGFSKFRMDLSHSGIVRALIEDDIRAKPLETALYGALRAKDVFALNELSTNLRARVRKSLLALPTLYGDASIIKEARNILPNLPRITSALNELEQLVKLTGLNEIATFDLADLRGYQYETGAIFALYIPGLPNSVVRGGRYDYMGEAFGRARPASGFSMDLRELIRILPSAEKRSSICAPWSHDPALRAKIMQLRQAGEIVIQTLPGHENDLDEFNCDRTLSLDADGNWIINY